MTTVSEITTIDYSGVPQVDALLNLAGGWNYLLPERTTLQYTFSLGAIAGQAPSAVSTFNATQKAAAQAILSYVSSVTGILFTETANAAAADFHFAACDLVGANTAGLCTTRSSYSYSGSDVVSYSLDAYVFLDNREHAAINGAPTSGSSGYEVLLHEIGHALGLGHPFDDPGSSDDGHTLPASQDNTNNTVMSYTHAGDNKSSFQSYDLMALNWLYGQDGLRGFYGLNSVNGPSVDMVANRSPIAADLHVALKEDTVQTGMLPTATDPDNDRVTYAKSSNPLYGTASVTANGQYTYTPLANYVGEDSFTYRVADGKGGASLYTVWLNVTDVQDIVRGTFGNDTLRGGSGNDRIEAGAGIDTVVYAGPRERYTITTTAEGLSVTDRTQPADVDQLISVERLSFANMKLAFDLGDNAGDAARLLGAALGPAALQNHGLVGVALAYFDAGPTLQQSASMLVDTGLMASFAGGADNRTFVESVWRNITGTNASAETSQALQALLDQGGWTQAQLLYVAMGMPENEARVNLVGLAENGLAYA